MLWNRIGFHYFSYLPSQISADVYLQFTVRPKDVDTFAGLTVRLDCAAQGKPTPIRVFWLIGLYSVLNVHLLIFLYIRYF